MGFFDPLSFGLGIGIGAGIGGGAAYAVLSRRAFAKKPAEELLQGEAEAPLTQRDRAREFLSPQAGRRYQQQMTQFFQKLHMAGDHLNLTEVLIEPRFIREHPATLIIEEEQAGVVDDADLYRVVPLLHELPAVYAAFHLETIGFRDLESGDKHVAILGVAGSGKTTTLALLGLTALGKIDPEQFKSAEQAQFGQHAEDEGLPAEVRERRRKEREEVQRKAIEKLRLIQHREEEIAAAEQRDAALDFNGLFPVYVHLRHVDLDPATYGGKIDPAEPFVKALPQYVDSGTATFIAAVLYKMLRAGRAMLLIDGYDDLTPLEREKYLPWFKALLEYYGENFIALTAPAAGYDALTHLGFADCFIAPLNERRTTEYLEKWLNASAIMGRTVGEAERSLVFADNRNRSILDITLKGWAVLFGQIKEAGRRGYYEAYIRHHLGDIPMGYEILRDAAFYWVESGQAPNRETLQKITARHLGGGEAAAGDKKGADTSKTDKALKQLAASMLTYALPDGGLALENIGVAWALAAETLRGADENRLGALAHKPLWHGPLSFAAAWLDLTPTVIERLKDAQNKPDLLFSKVFSMADWMPDAPSGMRWKAEVLKRLRGVILTPGYFPKLREYALAAMITARDEGVTYIFREAVRSGNPHIRMLGCLGIGAMGSGETVNDLAPMLVDDVVEVQLAAGLALGAIGNEPALDALADALLNGEEGLRKAVAEALSAIPGLGYSTLYEGITAEDMMVRRACTFGLARIPETWALVALYRAMLEDSQWYVRSAAEIAFKQAREPRRTGPIRYAEPIEYQWLAGWAAEKGEAIPEGPAGRQLLMRALQEAPAKIRVEAAKSLGGLGHLPALKALYASLGDQEPDVRIAAFNALGQFSSRMGRALPGLA